MLKKLDLAKQFELVVQQEIKNYQDSLNFVLQSIRELKDAIKEVREESLENYASLHSDHNDLKIELQKMTEVSSKHYLTVNRFINDQKNLNDRNLSQVLQVRDGISKSVDSALQLQDKTETIWHAICKLKSSTDTNHRLVNDNMDDLLRKFRQEISQTKKEIIESPTEASYVKSKLEEKIAAHKVDVAGIMRELTLYKHDNMVTQKKIENIYTLIARLQKSEVNP